MEERSVSPDRQAEVFGISGALAVPLPGEGGSVGSDPVPDVVHHVHDEGVGRVDRLPGVVDEATLDVAPAAAEPDPVVGAEQQLGVVLLDSPDPGRQAVRLVDRAFRRTR